VPATTSLTARMPASEFSTVENGKSVPNKILSAIRYSCAVIMMFQNCQGR
jgi:hypothetical protein